MIYHDRGAASELFAASQFAGRGYQVYFPAMTQSKSDFIAEVDGVLKKVQVKTGCRFNPKYPHLLQIRLGGCGRTRYSKGDFDLLVIVEGTRMWVIPTDVVDITQCSMSFATENVSGRKLKVDLTQYEWRTQWPRL